MSVTEVDFERPTRSLWAAHRDILVAMMLRDIRTRMAGSAWGFLLVIAWPLAHILIIVAIHSGLDRLPPYGDSMILWTATGVIPFMCFGYIARFTMMGGIQNKPLLGFPHIKITHVVISRVVIEVLNAFVVLLTMLLILAVLQIDFVPAILTEAVYGYMSAVLLGVGFGTLNCLIALAAPSWMTFYMLFYLILYFTSGVLFVPSALPPWTRDILYYNPLVHTLEWVREAYYHDYNSLILDRKYPIFIGLAFIFLGLSVERVLRGTLLRR